MRQRSAQSASAATATGWRGQQMAAQPSHATGHRTAVWREQDVFELAGRQGTLSGTWPFFLGSPAAASSGQSQLEAFAGVRAEGVLAAGRDHQRISAQRVRFDMTP
jgi:hypothetical protein